MFRWNEWQIVRFIHVYRVRPKRKQIQKKLAFNQGGWGPIFSIAWRGRMLVIGFHLATKPAPLSKERSDELWAKIQRMLAEDKLVKK